MQISDGTAVLDLAQLGTGPDHGILRSGLMVHDLRGAKSRDPRRFT